MGYLGLLEGMILGAGLVSFFLKEHKSYDDYEDIGYARNTPSEGVHPLICPPKTTVGYSEKEGRFVCCTNPTESMGITYCTKTNHPTQLGPGTPRPPRLLEPSRLPNLVKFQKNIPLLRRAYIT